MAKITKVCSGCKEEKPTAEFSRDRSNRDGRNLECRSCVAVAAKSRYERDPEKYRVRYREYYRKNRKKIKERYSSEEEFLKRKARSAVNRAIELGELRREPCEVCGNPKSIGHHEDYTKPLEVDWLCQKHHGARHAAIRAEADRQEGDLWDKKFQAKGEHEERRKQKRKELLDERRRKAKKRIRKVRLELLRKVIQIKNSPPS
jgi:hypothetical protein